MNDSTATQDQTTAAPDTARAVARETLIAGLRNAHALEKQAIAVLDAQLGRLDDYPDLKERLSEHVRESREQARRLEGALDDCGASSSMVKDALMSIMGLGQSSVQGLADDAVLKAVLADIMFENLEVASYRSLLELAELAGVPEVAPRLQQSLDEEIAMADWLEENLSAITRRYVQLTAAAQDAEAAASTPEPGATPWYAKEPQYGAAGASARSAEAQPVGEGGGAPTSERRD